MGQFLNIGFVAEAETTVYDGMSADDVLRAINGIYSPDTFDVLETDRKITLKLNSATVCEELIPFVSQVYEDYHGPAGGKRLQKTVDFITGIVEEHNWLEKAEEECSYDFQPLKYEMYDKFVVSGKEVWLFTYLIQLGCEGKFLMEEYRHTLSFMETCAQRAYGNFRLGKTFRVFVY